MPTLRSAYGLRSCRVERTELLAPRTSYAVFSSRSFPIDQFLHCLDGNPLCRGGSSASEGVSLGHSVRCGGGMDRLPKGSDLHRVVSREEEASGFSRPAGGIGGRPRVCFRRPAHTRDGRAEQATARMGRYHDLVRCGRNPGVRERLRHLFPQCPDGAEVIAGERRCRTTIIRRSRSRLAALKQEHAKGRPHVPWMGK